MSGALSRREESERVRADGDWWVLLVTDGLTIEYPPELYRDHEQAEREGNRWAHLLSVRSGNAIEQPFEGRWQIGDRWVRLVYSFLPEESSGIWVGTYWGRDGSPEPEAELFADAADAHAWVLEPPAGGLPIESYETRWSVFARYEVRGGEEEAEVHECKIVAGLVAPRLQESRVLTVRGFEVSEGLIPQGPDLFASEARRDQALRQFLEHEMTNRDWRNFMMATATGNYVEGELPPNWRETWDRSQALEWLLGFDFISDGDGFEVRSFDASVDDR